MIRQQVVRYAVIGLLLDAALYGAYPWLTHVLMGSREAMMTLTCGSGVLFGFALNCKITFREDGGKAGALPRYFVSNLIGYGINFAALWFLAGQLGIRLQIVQGGMTVTLPINCLTLQRYWVFPVRSSQNVKLSVSPIL